VITASVARRYARALLSLGVEEGRHEQYGDELELVLSALQESREVAHILGNPGFTLQQRHAAAEALAAVLRLSPFLLNFLRLLVDRQRSGDLPAIARAYRALLDQQVGRVRATVISAQPLSDGELSGLREAIARSTGRNIVLQAKTDPALIGGVVTQVGATLLDGSLRTQLERMREELKRAPL
jgi:F-type H+-transporting ATPase subunit delta